MNFDEICISSFSSVSPKFWKFSSQRVRTRWDLAETPKNFFSEKFFEVEKMGQNCIFRILSEDFSAFFNRCCGNFESLGRDGGVFYPKVKKESKNRSIPARMSRGKNAIFQVVCLTENHWKIILVITLRNRRIFERSKLLRKQLDEYYPVVLLAKGDPYLWIWDMER